MSESTPLFIFKSPKPYHLRQMQDNCQDEPKWFAYPMKKAGFDLHFRPELNGGLSKLRGLMKDYGDLCALAFLPGRFETLACSLFGRRLRLCSLFQWRALENVPFHKRLCYRRILDQSKVIAVYDAVSESYMRKIYPRKPIVRIGLFADTDFFRPLDSQRNDGGYVVCPGSNFRLEDVVCEVADRLSLPVIRYSENSSVQAYYSRNPSSKVSFRYKISYIEMRELLSRANLVLNITDDTQVPAGIYAFCQSLSMDRVVVTPDMHSSSGYELEGGRKPYHAVHDPFDPNSWVAIAEQALSGKATIQGSPRELAEKWCSLSRSVSDWQKIRELLMS